MGENGRTPRKTTWHTRKQNLACLTCGQSGARNHTRHSGETKPMFYTGRMRLCLNIIYIVWASYTTCASFPHLTVYGLYGYLCRYFLFSLTSLSRLFHLIMRRTNPAVGGAKTEDPREKKKQKKTHICALPRRSVSCTRINHSRCALVICSALQLTSKQ